jgi:signal transduction histidine kinase/ActR/RegA family two-component response regulator
VYYPPETAQPPLTSQRAGSAGPAASIAVNRLPRAGGQEGPQGLQSRPQRLLELACKIARAGQGGIGLLSAEGELLEYLTVGLPERSTSELRHWSWGHEVARFVLQQARPTRVANLAHALPHLGVPPGLPAVGPFLGVPINCLASSPGSLYLARSPGEPAFGHEDEELLVHLTALLEQGSLFEEAHLLDQLRLLNHVAQAAAGNLELSSILTAALRELNRYLPLHVSVVWLADNRPEIEDRAGGSNGSRSTVSLTLASIDAAHTERALALGLVPGLRLRLAETPFAACLSEGQAVYADLGRPEERLASWRCPLTESLARRGATFTVVTPLRAGDRSVGVLQSVCTRPTGFTSWQIQLLYLVADLLGPAISNCQLFARLSTAYEELRITQDHLIQAEKLRALGELAGGMAHEFNNSLCGVLGFLELALLDQNLDGANRAYLESARTCALDAAQTVRRVQDFARRRRNDPAIQPLDLNELVRQTVELTRHKWENLTYVGRTPIAVHVSTEATAWVSGRATELREVLTNLLFNAVDALPEGGQISVRTWNTATDVYVAVRDSGVGMTEAVQQRLFEPFFTTKGENGNGLGLSVTFGIVQSHGGDIRVVSEVGRGTTFTVRLPGVPGGRDGAGPREPGSAEPAGHPAAAHAADSPGLRVLVIEDEESIRRFLEGALTQLGHRPRLAADAPEGLAAFEDEPFDLILTDLSLPGASGEEVARAISRRSPQTPVVMLTGWADQLKVDVKPLEGVARVLAKPVTLETLAETLTAVGVPQRPNLGR